MSLLAVLAGILRMLLGVGRMFLALYVVVFSVMFGRSAMGFSGILVMFGCLIVGVFRHGIPPVSVGWSDARVTAGHLNPDWVGHPAVGWTPSLNRLPQLSYIGVKARASEKENFLLACRWQIMKCVRCFLFGPRSFSEKP
jgi:hypothetical protein